MKTKAKGIYIHGDSYLIDFTYKGTRVQKRACSLDADGAFAFAKKLLAKLKTEVAEGRHLNVKKEVKTTFAELAEMYKNEFGVKLKSWKNSGAVYSRHLIKHFGDMPVQGIYVTHVKAYQDSRRKETGPHEVNRELSLLRRIFNLASAYWRNPNNPDEPLFSGVNPVKIIKGGALQFDEEMPRGVYLTRGRLIMLLEHCDPSLRDYIMFAIVTGLRVSEQKDLKPKHINTKEGWLFLLTTKNGKPRYVPLCGIARSILESGADFSYDPRRRAWRTALKGAKIDDLHWHDLRHTTATYLEEKDVPGEKIGLIMGHKQATVTDVYKNLHPIKKVQKLIPHVEALDIYLADVYWRPIACRSHVEKSIQKEANRYGSINTPVSPQIVTDQRKELRSRELQKS